MGAGGPPGLPGRWQLWGDLCATWLKCPGWFLRTQHSPSLYQEGVPPDPHLLFQVKPGGKAHLHLLINVGAHISPGPFSQKQERCPEPALVPNQHRPWGPREDGVSGDRKGFDATPSQAEATPSHVPVSVPPGKSSGSLSGSTVARPPAGVACTAFWRIPPVTPRGWIWVI